MTKLITGDHGPFSLEEPGGYGRNASHNFMQMERAALSALEEGNRLLIEELQQTTIRYTPASQPAFHDAFAFAEAEIARFDEATRDGMLDLDELAGLFGSNRDFAEQCLKVLDRDNSRRIGVVEYAAFILFSDDAASLIADTLEAFDSTGSDALFADADREELKAMAHQFREHYPTTANGEVTPMGRLVADMSILKLSTFAGVTIDGIIRNLKLVERYEQYKALQA